MMDMIGEGRSELPDLVLPVEHQRGRTYDQGAQPPIGIPEMLQERKGLYRLTQTHIVRQDTSPAYFLEIVEPMEPMYLVRAEDRLQVCGRRYLPDTVELAQLLILLFQPDDQLFFIPALIQLVDNA